MKRTTDHFKNDDDTIITINSTCNKKFKSKDDDSRDDAEITLHKMNLSTNINKINFITVLNNLYPNVTNRVKNDLLIACGFLVPTWSTNNIYKQNNLELFKLYKYRLCRHYQNIIQSVVDNFNSS
ncbi:hypothetical protein A3Q56_07095 [Intoshia linei]|uniref:Uncharacterized protein n=1 Tax=Intoshia linei TaxID=1819745 RepID=A0A177AUJ0_9BILA|nr:hypothetical protein A3Q56_07095 [Intoshia linei]